MPSAPEAPASTPPTQPLFPLSTKAHFAGSIVPTKAFAHTGGLLNPVYPPKKTCPPKLVKIFKNKRNLINHYSSTFNHYYFLPLLA